VGQPRGSQPRRDDARLAGVQLALDGVAGDHRVIDEQSQRQDERGDGHLLQVDAQQMHEPEGHGQGQRNRQRHERRRPPFPESDERHQNHQDDRLVQAVHEQLHALGHLQRLVGGPGQDQVRREQLPQLAQRHVHFLAEFADLFAGPHLDRKGDGAGTLPPSGGIPDGEEVQVGRGALIAAEYVRAVAQVNRRAVVGGAHDHIADLPLALELPRGVDHDVLAAGLQHAARQHDIAGVEDLLDLALLHAGGRQSFLGIFQEHPLVQNAGAVDLGNRLDGLQGFLDQIGVIVELPESVLVAGDGRQLGPRLLGILHHERFPDIRMKIGQARLDAFPDKGPEFSFVVRALEIEAGETWSLDGARVCGEFGFPQLALELQHAAVDDPRPVRLREAEDDGRALLPGGRGRLRPRLPNGPGD